MEKVSDWGSIRRRAAEWKQFFPTDASLNALIMFCLPIIPLGIHQIWRFFTYSDSANLWLWVGPILSLTYGLVGACLILNYLRIKRDKAPVIALNRDFVALKRLLFPGYFLIKWQEIEAFLPAGKKNSFSLKLKNKKRPLPLCCKLSEEDEKHILVFATQHIQNRTAPTDGMHSSGNYSASAITQHGTIAPPQKPPKTRIRTFFKKLLITALVIIGAFIALIIFIAVDISSKTPTHEELLTNGRHPPYEAFISAYPSYSLDTEQVVLNYAFIYNGWLIAQKCHNLSTDHVRKTKQNMPRVTQLFESFLVSRFQLSSKQAREKIRFLHAATTSQLGALVCDQKAEKQAYYAYRNAKKWTRNNKVQPYILKK